MSSEKNALDLHQQRSLDAAEGSQDDARSQLGNDHLACLACIDHIEVAELAAQALQSVFQDALEVMGLPRDFYDQLDTVIEPARLLGEPE